MIMTKKNCLFVLGSHFPSAYYCELNFDYVFPFYLVTNGDKTILEKKLDELVKKYNNVYVYESNPNYCTLLNSFFSYKEDYASIHILSKIDLLGNLLKPENMVIEVWDSGIREEEDQKNYLFGLKSENTCRYFNRIIFTEDGRVIKEAKTPEAIKLQKIENKFYDTYKDIPCLCKKDNYISKSHHLVLKKVNGMTAQKWYGKTGDYVGLINKVKEALNVLNNTNITIEDSPEDIKEAFYNELISKIDSRVMPCKRLIDYFIDTTEINTIDNMEITKSYGKLMIFLKKWYKDNEDKFKACLCHGDPNTDNTMVDKDGNIVFIDPRGYFGNLKTIGLGMAEYDLAKFCYGLNGYSVFNSAPYIEISFSDDNENIYVSYPNDITSITQIDLDVMPIDDNTRIIIGIIWMKLTSYIINDPMKSVIAYLYGNAICTKYLKKLGYMN